VCRDRGRWNVLVVRVPREKFRKTDDLESALAAGAKMTILPTLGVFTRRPPAKLGCRKSPPRAVVTCTHISKYLIDS
jgi:hypothetical protein